MDFWNFAPGCFFALVALVMIIVEPRRISCAVMVGFSLVSLAIGSMSFLQYVEQGTGGYWILAILGIGLLLVLFLDVLLIWSGITLLHREGFSLAHSLALLLGLLTLGYLVAAFVGVAAYQWLFVGILMLLGFPLSYLAFVLVAYLIYSSAYVFVVKRFYRRYQTVVALGAGLDGDELTPLLRARVDLAIKKANANDSLLVLSGGKGPDEVIAEGVAMANYARSRGVPDSRIVVEDKSRNTFENLGRSMKMVGGDGKWLAVSSDYHAFRAACIMRTIGMRGGAIGAPTPRYFWAAAVLREFVAMIRAHIVLNVIMLLLACVPLIMMVVSVWRAA